MSASALADSEETIGEDVKQIKIIIIAIVETLPNKNGKNANENNMQLTKKNNFFKQMISDIRF